jgi:hypothetical protein
MHPGMMAWWQYARRHGAPCGDEATACSPSHGGGHGAHGEGGHAEGHRHERGRHGWGGRHGDEGGAYASPDHDDFGGFGVRRPLRFLSHKLELDEAQTTELARVLNELKTERAQAAVDYRRTTAAIADAIAAESLDDAKLAQATSERVKSAERLRDAVGGAIRKIHGLLTTEQRGRFAYLIRTGVLSI